MGYFEDRAERAAASFWGVTPDSESWRACGQNVAPLVAAIVAALREVALRAVCETADFYGEPPDGVETDAILFAIDAEPPQGEGDDACQP